MSDFGNIMLWNGDAQIKTWLAPDCNKVFGTDGTAFAPNVKRDTVLTIFNPELCRRLSMIYEKDELHEGIPIYRFEMSRTFFDPAAEENQCYCWPPKPRYCGYNGTFVVKRCKFGSPIALSKPHFLGGHPSLMNFGGISPDPIDHDSYMKIVPKLGIPVSVKLRLQINLMISRRVRTFKEFKNIKDMTFPVFWFETGMDSLPQHLVTQLKMAVVYPELVRWTAGGLLVTTSMILAFASTVYMLKTSAQSPDVTEVKAAAQEDRKSLIGFSKSNDVDGEIHTPF